jgi:hypothetical protein
MSASGIYGSNPPRPLNVQLPQNRKSCCKPDPKRTANILLGVGISLIIVSVIMAIALNVLAAYLALTASLLIVTDIVVSILSTTGGALTIVGIFKKCCASVAIRRNRV